MKKLPYMPMPKLGEHFFLSNSFVSDNKEFELNKVCEISRCGKKIKRYDSNAAAWWNWEKELQGYVRPVTKLDKLIMGLDNEL